MYDIITIGTATRDVFLQSPLFRVVHDPEHLAKIGFPTGEAQCFALGGKVEIDAPVMTIGGGATNAAVTFARQELKTAAIISLGKDENADAILKALKVEGIEPIITEDPKEMTAYSVILLSSTGERTILTHRGASVRLRLEEIDQKNLLTKAAYIVPGDISVITIKSLLKDLKASGAFLAMNPSKRYVELGEKLRPMLKMLDVVTLNREEAAYLTGINYEDMRGIFKKFDEFIPGIAVITDGANGVWVSDGKRLYRAGIFSEKKLIDRTGSGDAFGSGFVAGLLHEVEPEQRKEFNRETIERAIRWGSANATSVVESIGAQAGILSKEALENDVRWKNLTIEVSDL